MGYHTLFLDIGGVLLTNGWDRHSRQKAAERFYLNEEDMNGRHALMFDPFEIGKISLDDYLDHVVFYEPRSFTREDFKTFIFEQSQPYPEMLQLMKEMKQKYQLKVVVVSNEGRELMIYRADRFKLRELVDFCVCSSFVHLKKPDYEIYQFAIDMAQVKPQEVIYIDDRLLLTQIGAELGLKIIHHQSYHQTRQLLEELLQGS